VASKPAWITEYPSYEQIVNSWGWPVEAFETFGSYQGDHLALLQEGQMRFGLIVFGYGSCSGCDWLEDVAPWDDEGDWQGVIDLSAKLREDIHWERTRADLTAWVDAHPENNWWCYDAEIATWLNRNLGTHLREDV
jgi:hypothetical protein